MSIPTACSCGKRVNAPDHLAGKTVKCPGCGNPLAIPQASSGSHELFDEAGMAEGGCPKCGAEMSPTAVLCVACGFNRQTGEQLKGVAAKAGGHKGATDELLGRAEAELADRPVQHEGAYGNKGQEWGVMAIMLTIALAVVIAFFSFFQHMESKNEAAKEQKQTGAASFEQPNHALAGGVQHTSSDGPAAEWPTTA